MTNPEKVVFITGGSSGIGLAAARLFLERNFRVAIVAQGQERLEQARSQLNPESRRLLAIQADVSQPDEIQHAVQQVIEHWHQLDVVFANAGVNGVWAPLEEIADDEWLSTVATNLHGTFYTIKAAVPHLKRGGGGSIVVTSSVNGTRMFSNTGATAYACSKAAQVALTKMLALELAKDKIRVNVVCPGWIETEIEDSTEKRHLKKVSQPVKYPAGTVPLTKGAAGESKDVAELVLFLSSDAACHITGTEVWIDGAQSLLQG